MKKEKKKKGKGKKKETERSDGLSRCRFVATLKEFPDSNRDRGKRKEKKKGGKGETT